MSFLNHLQTLLGEDVIVTEELNFNYSGSGVMVVIKYLSGSNFRQSIIQPIQLVVYTDDVPAAKTLFDNFTKTYNNVSYIDGLDYIQQIYSTPSVMSNFQPVGINFTQQLVVNGILVISTNVSEIKEVKIDGEVYETSSRIISYVASVDNQRKNGEYINKTNIRNGMVKFNCTMINKADTLSQKIRSIRTGTTDIDNSFTIWLKYSDNDVVEQYTMKLDSATINSENQTLPILSLSFVE